MHVGTRLVLLAVVVAVVLLAWSPWITAEDARQVVLEKFAERWENVADGCGFSCEGCGVGSVHRVLFGYVVQIKYGCGMKTGDHFDDIFVTTGYTRVIRTVVLDY